MVVQLGAHPDKEMAGDSHRTGDSHKVVKGVHHKRGGGPKESTEESEEDGENDRMVDYEQHLGVPAWCYRRLLPSRQMMMER